MSTIVEIKNLTVRYGDRTVLRTISTAFSAGEIRIILGTSGCGKTTLLKAIVGLTPLAGGEVKLFGQSMADYDTPQAMAILQKTGVLFQNGALLGSLTVAENVALPLTMHTTLSRAIIAEMVQLKLEQVAMPHAANRYPSELSGGMRKRAALARALALDPPLLFCDEPSAGLDPVTSAGLDELLLSLRKSLGITIVVVTHELFSIDAIADNVIFLHKGDLLFDGSLKDAKAATEGPLHNFFNRLEPVDKQAAKSVFFVEQTV